MSDSKKSKSASYKEKVASLTAAIEKSEGNTGGSGSSLSCFPTTMVIGVLIPLITALILTIVKPKFVMKSEAGVPKRNIKKIFAITVGITVASWAALYAYNNYKGMGSSGATCVATA